MRFGILSGGSSPGLRHDIRYHEVLEEVGFADDLGYDFFGSPEQHFLGEYCSTAAAECFYGAVAMRTKRIRLRSAITLLPVNHPIRVAEQAATLDILSRGRYEIGTGRSNQLLQLEAFGIPATETRARWKESLEVIVKALSEDPFSHEGTYYKIPPRSLVPKSVQKPHPPLFVASSGIETHQIAGRLGLGVLSFSNFGGFGEVARFMSAYREAIKECSSPIGKFVTNSFGVLVVPGHCADTTKQAVDEAKDRALAFASIVGLVYTELGKTAPEYRYMEEAVEKVRDKLEDVDYLINESAGVIIGDPDQCVKQVQRFEQLGVDEIMMDMDGIPHQQIMKSIEMFAHHVIPHFKIRTGYP